MDSFVDQQSQEPEKTDVKKMREEILSTLDNVFVHWLDPSRDYRYTQPYEIQHDRRRLLESRISLLKEFGFSSEGDSGDKMRSAISALKKAVDSAQSIDRSDSPDLTFITLGFPYYVIDSHYGGNGDVSKHAFLKLIPLVETERYLLGGQVTLEMGRPRYNCNKSAEENEGHVAEAEDFIDKIVGKNAEYEGAILRFMQLKPEVAAYIVCDHKRVYTQLLSTYSEITSSVLSKASELESLRSAMLTLEQYGVKSYEELSTLLQYVPHENRAHLWPIRHLTFQELKRKIEDETQLLFAEDKNRYQLHRFIEFFAFQTMHGRSTSLVRWDIQRQIDSGDYTIFPIAGEIYGIIDYQGDTIEIDLGSGSRASHSRDLDQAALDFRDKEDYISKIAKGRSFDVDAVLASHIVNSLKKQFPFLIVENEFYEGGSYHERFRDFKIKIYKNQLDEAGFSRNPDAPQAIWEEIATAIRKIIEEKLSEH